MFTRRILVVEDELLLCDLLVAACVQHGFDARGVGSAREALETISEFDPDLVVLDVDLGDGPTGADLGSMLGRTHPDIALLYLTRLTDLRAAGYRAPQPGVSVSFLRKESIESVADFVAQVEASLRGVMVGRRDDLDVARPLAELTDAQLEVLRLASLGLSNRAIASTRRTSEGAVEGHLTSIFRILGIPPSKAVNRRSMAIRRYVEATGRPISRPQRELQLD